jgi:glycosyltransferase involved in cell wall biosynthesis
MQNRSIDQQMTDGKKISVAITSPGWPLNRFPNGIVTYIHNLLIGLDAISKPIVMAAPLLVPEVKNRFIDLSRLEARRSVLQQLLDKILFRFSGAYVQKIQYQRNMAKNANKILLAVQQLDAPLDILEIEESFGTASEVIKNTTVPVITRLHGPWFIHGPIMKMDSEQDYQIRIFYEGEAIKSSCGVTSPSLDVLEKTRQYYGIDLPHAKVVPNPVCEVSPEKRWEYNPKITPSILVVGRFDLHKGGDLVLEAFRQVALQNSTVELLFVGPDRGVTIDGVNYHFDEYVERFIADNSIKKRIQFLGHCDHERIAELRKNALVTIVCSRYENFPLSLLESLAAGCPTVATAVGGMKEIIIDDFNGLLAEPESPASIAEKVLLLINDPEKMQRLSQHAIEDCKKRFSPEVVAAQTVDYYQSVLNRVAKTSA